MNSIEVSLLPEGSIQNYDPNIRSPKMCFQIALEEVQKASDLADSAFEATHNLVTFSHTVRNIECLFKALTLHAPNGQSTATTEQDRLLEEEQPLADDDGSEDTANVEANHSRVIAVKGNDDSPKELSPIDALTRKFAGLIITEDTQGRTAFERGDFKEANRKFSVLQEALDYEKGSERDFYIQACALSTQLKACTATSLIPQGEVDAVSEEEEEDSSLEETGPTMQVEDNIHKSVTVAKEGASPIENDVREVISSLIRFEKMSIPHKLLPWTQKNRDAIVKYVRDQLAQNNTVVQSVWSQLEAEAKRITDTLTLEKLQKIVDMEPYLALLTSIQKTLNVLGTKLHTCVKINAVLEKFHVDLKIPFNNNYDATVSLHKKWAALNRSAIKLLTALNRAASTEAKNEILIKWIEEHISSYKCKVEELSALHKWALSLWGKFFISTQLTQTCLNKSISLMRKYPEILLPHSTILLCDVRLHVGELAIEINQLLLGAVSDQLKEDCCTVEELGRLHGKKWKDARLVGGLIGGLSKLLSSGNTESEMPEIKVDLSIRAGEESSEDAKTIFSQRAKAIYHLLDALQNNKYDGLLTLKAPEVVALFEIIKSLLMPPAILALWRKKLDTPDFRDKLTAVLWLRFAQASRVELPYTDLDDLLKDISAKDFLKWISLYDPTQVVMNKKCHHLLLPAVAAAAKRLLLDKKHHFSNEEARKIFAFITERYEEYLTMPVQTLTKHQLNAQVILLLGLCITKIQNIAPQSPVEFLCQPDYVRLEEQESQEDSASSGPASVLKQLDCLRTEEIEGVKSRFTPEVLACFNSVIYPQLKDLDLYEGVATVGLGDFRKCKQLTSLTMPLPIKDADKTVMDLAQVWTTINTLKLRDGVISLKSINEHPLTSLSLTRVSGDMNFAECDDLRANLEHLALWEVDINEDSLSWVANSDRLTSICIRPARGRNIGSLANDTYVHDRPSLCSLELNVDDFDQDPKLVTSIPKLLSTYSTISAITLCGLTSESLLNILLANRKAPEDKQIEALAMTCNPSENLELLAQFRRLKVLTFFTDSEVEAARVRRHVFKGCKDLTECWLVASDGTRVSVPIRRE